MVVACLSTALACSGQAGPASGGTLYLSASAPTSLDPARCADATTSTYVVELFSGLVTLDADLQVTADIAESWEVDESGTVYTFYLRDNAVFHDGRRVSAADFKYSMERAADPDTGSPVAEAYLGDIVGFRQRLLGEVDEVSGVRVVDDSALEITIDAPNACFLAKLTHPSAFVVDSQNVAAGGDWWRQPNGTGPFSLKEWREGERIVLQRNDSFYRGAASLDEVVFTLRGNPMMMYESGQIDIVQVSTADIDRVRDPSNPLNDQLVVATELSVYYIGFNNDTPPFDDVKVRQAFCHAVDKEKVIGILSRDTVAIAYGVLPPGIPGYNEELEGLTYNVSRARQLLAASGYSDSLPPVVLSVPGNLATVSSVDAAVAWMWQQELGAEVELQAVDWDSFVDETIGQELQSFAVGWIADYPDAENFLDLLFHSQSVENHTAYSNAGVDALLEQARVATDAGARLELYRQAEGIIVDEAAWLPLWYGQNYYLVKPWVRGYTPSPMVIPVLRDVWLAE